LPTLNEENNELNNPGNDASVNSAAIDHNINIDVNSIENKNNETPNNDDTNNLDDCKVYKLAPESDNII
jgi:hypothetical protein